MMRKLAVIFTVVLLIAAACAKTTDPLPTAAERLAMDIVILDEYLEKNNIEAVKLESGVRYVIKEQGTGPLPTKDNCIRFKYSAYAIDGTTSFDSNTEDGLKSPLKNLILGMQIGLKKMPLGTKGVIYVPSAMGYPNGVWDTENERFKVNPNTCIWFEVEIIALYEYNTLGNYCYE